ncbi:proline-specific peptidase [Aulographum hederae CBS 113979]|uniref:Proline-specific peptidase n=1 Tax=Aulographum hederae CBS 113979 TaxID=1176131 RepID=A0A6G1H9W7_9PEZI|nr:proline-specific peptidase [Aulographum hederae CBS 113979]
MALSPTLIHGTVPFADSTLPRPAQTAYLLYHHPSAPAPTPSTFSSLRPLLVLHGGPGATHSYLTPLADLVTPTRPVILYDQIGCGKSTRYREKKGDEEFWSVGLFVRELRGLLEGLGVVDFDLFGNSWGGMLGAEYAVRYTKASPTSSESSGPELRHLIIADSPADMKDWVSEAERLRAQLPGDVQAVLDECEKEGRTESEEYEDAVFEFYKRHLCRVEPLPEGVVRMMEGLKEDSTVYHTMNGPSEFHVVGSLKDWSIKDRLKEIDVPTLLLNGRYDEATDEVVRPYFQGIRQVKWFTFAESSHMPHYEERELFMKVVDGFLSM